MKYSGKSVLFILILVLLNLRLIKLHKDLPRMMNTREYQIQSNREIELIVDEEKRSNIKKIVDSAYDALGKSYKYDSSGKDGYDCSGFVYKIYLDGLDIELPRRAKDQAKIGDAVDLENIIAGDLLFFNTLGDEISHVGIYVGNGNMIHASSNKGEVSIDSISIDYFKNNFIVAKRIVGTRGQVFCPSILKLFS